MSPKNVGHDGHNIDIKSHELRSSLIKLSWLQHKATSEMLKPWNLTAPQFFTLSTLNDMGGEATVGKLASTSFQAPASMTGIIDRLVRDGLVTRSWDKEDRRTVLVSITPAGEELLNKALNKVFVSLDSAISVLTPEQIEAARHFVDAFISNMQNEME